jgi:hypothetical protein
MIPLESLFFDAFLLDLHEGLVNDSVRGTPIEVVDGMITYVMTHLETLGVVAAPDGANNDEV